MQATSSNVTTLANSVRAIAKDCKTFVEFVNKTANLNKGIMAKNIFNRLLTVVSVEANLQ